MHLLPLLLLQVALHLLCQVSCHAVQLGHAAVALQITSHCSITALVPVQNQHDNDHTLHLPIVEILLGNYEFGSDKTM
jgi:hypothetical protein